MTSAIRLLVSWRPLYDVPAAITFRQHGDRCCLHPNVKEMGFQDARALSVCCRVLLLGSGVEDTQVVCIRALIRIIQRKVFSCL